MQKIYDRKWINTRTEYQWVDGKGYVKVYSEGYWYKGPLALASNPPVRVGNSWAFYSDGTESGSSIIGSIDTNPTKGDITYDSTFFFRADEEETAGNKALNQVAQLEYRINTGGGYGSWLPVSTTSSVIRTTATSNIADGATTSRRLGTSYSFVSPNGGFDEGNGIAGTSNSDLQSNGMEWLWSVQMRSADVSEDDLIQLRYTLDGDGTLLDTEPTWPTITAPAVAGTTYTCTGNTQGIKAEGTGVSELTYQVYTATSDTQGIKAEGTGVSELTYQIYTATGNTQAKLATVTGSGYSEVTYYADLILLREPKLLLPQEKPVNPVRINWEHPSTRGLLAAYLFTKETNKRIKDITGFGPDIILETAGSVYPTIKVWHGEIGLYFTGTDTHYAYIEAGKIPSGGDNVNAIMFGSTANTSSSVAIANIYGPTGTTSDFQVWVGTPSLTYKVQVHGATGQDTLAYTDNINGDRINTIYWANASASTQGLYTYRNKVHKTTTSSYPGTTWPASGRKFLFGVDADAIGSGDGDGNLDQYYTGIFNYWFFFNREFDEGEARSLNENPYQFLIPA